MGFKEVKSDLFTFEADIKFITTNGAVKDNGRAVMGRGCALEAKNLIPGIDKLLGDSIKEYGNIPNYLVKLTHPHTYELWSFPVKHHWSDYADISLIINSCEKIEPLLLAGHKVALPRPGCGNGHLHWKEDVQPIIEHYLNYDNLYILSK